MSSLVFAWSLSARADDRPLPHGFTPPAALPLFSSAGHRDAKGSVKGDDCAGAVAAALDDLAHGGKVLAVDGDGTVLCKQRKAGDAVSASLVELSGWWAVPSPSGPATPAERQVALAKVLAGLLPAEAPVVLEPGAGGAWLVYPTLAPEAPPVLATPEERAAAAFGDWVSEWVPKWATLVGALPELAGGRLDVSWPADKAKNGTLRFEVPKEPAARWLGGNLADDGLAAAMTIAWSPDPKKAPFQRLTVDVEAGEPRTAPAVEPEVRSIDVKQEDLEGLEDEVPPKPAP